MTETEIIETEVTEPEEHIENPAAVLKKNRELLADLKNLKERTSSLEELARAVGLDDAALADPRGHIAKRAENAAAEEQRTRVIRETALLKLAAEGRTVSGDIEAVLGKVVSDPNVKIEDGKVTGLDGALAKLAPKRAAPGAPSPWSGMTMQRPAAPKSFEELQSRGTAAVSAFAAQSPEAYASLKADFDKRLAKGTSLR